MPPTTPELATVAAQLKKATCPEAVFGKLGGKDPLADARKTYHRLAKACHEDKFTSAADKTLAGEAFKLLSHWWTLCQQKLDDKTYGDRKVKVAPVTTPVPVTVQSKQHIYVVGDRLAVGDLADISLGSFADGSTTVPVILKVARSPADTDLLTAERDALTCLNRVKEAEFRVPKLVESFVVQDSANVRRAANVFERFDGLYSLEHVAKACGPLDPRDVAWMANRLWACLGVTHANNLVHGSVLPCHALISPGNHGMILVDWCYSVKRDAKEVVKAVSPAYKSFYPTEVLAKKTPTPATDIYMAALTITTMLGGKMVDSRLVFPPGVPVSMQRFLLSCALPSPTRRPDDAWALQDEWKDLLKKAFGAPKFRNFHVPEPATA